MKLSTILLIAVAGAAWYAYRRGVRIAIQPKPAPLPESPLTEGGT